jgi:hypothetical protein
VLVRREIDTEKLVTAEQKGRNGYPIHVMLLEDVNHPACGHQQALETKIDLA